MSNKMFKETDRVQHSHFYINFGFSGHVVLEHVSSKLSLVFCSLASSTATASTEIMILLLFWMDSASRSGLKRPIEWVGVAVMTLKVGIDIWLSGEGGVVGKEGVALGKGDRAGLSAGLQVLQWKTKCFLIYDLPSYFKVIRILKNGVGLLWRSVKKLWTFEFSCPFVLNDMLKKV